MPINTEIHTQPNQKNYTKIIRVKESKEFMTQLNKIADLLENSSNQMAEGVYLNMYNELMNLYCLDLTMDIIVKAGGRVINQNRVSMTYEEKRKAVKNGNPNMDVCKNCLRIVRKNGMKTHLKSDICRDNRVVFNATNANLDNANAKAVDEYVLNGAGGANNDALL